MFEQLKQLNCEEAPAELYSTNWEYLSDELRRLDLLLTLELLNFTNNTPIDALNQFKGLVITEAEVNSLLHNNRLAADVQCDEYYKLQQKLLALSNKIAHQKILSINNNLEIPLVNLSERFKLTNFEEQVLIICLAVELERKYEKIYAYLQDDITCKKPSVDLILKLLCCNDEVKIAARSFFNQDATLIKHKIIILENPSNPLISRFLKLDDHITEYLLGNGQFDRRLTDFASCIWPQSNTSSVSKLTNPKLVLTEQQWQSILSFKQPIIINFHGPTGSGKKFQVQIICAQLQLTLIMVDLLALINGVSSDLVEILELVRRESILHRAVVCLDNYQCLYEKNEKNALYLNKVCQLLNHLEPVTFLTGTVPFERSNLKTTTIFVDYYFSVPETSERIDLWQLFAQNYSVASWVNFKEIASKYNFTPGQIKKSLETGFHLAVKTDPENPIINSNEIYTACQLHSDHDLRRLARKLQPKSTFADIVLPDEQLEQLQEICNQLQYYNLIFDEWGFNQKLSLGKGITVLFSGAPGTGKTMAAEIIANELKLEIYKIDLSQVISKYIGETEKNLGAIFDSAVNSNAILFFDEADALFGKRAEVKDAHDRYANIETGYLLQRMEDYSGIIILATNLSQNMDEAFLRRIRFTVDFPFPTAVQRECIWKRIFPKQTPLSPELDFAFLGERLKIAGGSIKNIALNAAFYAAKEETSVSMVHILRAVKREYRKIGKTFIASEFEPYSNLEAQ